ncbi:Maf family protein [Myxococcota bacterium]|nr:Maf family protein [Myxococcota bacterium]
MPAASPPLVLASASPRRRELLRAAGIEAAVVAAEVDESPRAGEAPGDLALRLASEKARAVAARADCPGRFVLAADTVVALGDRLLGKPADAAEAAATLGALSGREHEVLTGVCLLDRERPGEERAFVARTRISFRALSAGDVARYVATGEPMDKAGAYGIQGRGGALVATVQGSYTNVVGLPLAETLAALAAAGIPLEPR